MISNMRKALVLKAAKGNGSQKSCAGGSGQLARFNSHAKHDSETEKHEDQRGISMITRRPSALGVRTRDPEYRKSSIKQSLPNLLRTGSTHSAKYRKHFVFLCLVMLFFQSSGMKDAAAKAQRKRLQPKWPAYSKPSATPPKQEAATDRSRTSAAATWQAVATPQPARSSGPPPQPVAKPATRTANGASAEGPCSKNDCSADPGPSRDTQRTCHKDKIIQQSLERYPQNPGKLNVQFDLKVVYEKNLNPFLIELLEDLDMKFHVPRILDFCAGLTETDPTSVSPLPQEPKSFADRIRGWDGTISNNVQERIDGRAEELRKKRYDHLTLWLSNLPNTYLDSPMDSVRKVTEKLRELEPAHSKERYWPAMFRKQSLYGDWQNKPKIFFYKEAGEPGCGPKYMGRIQFRSSQAKDYYLRRLNGATLYGVKRVGEAEVPYKIMTHGAQQDKSSEGRSDGEWK